MDAHVQECAEVCGVIGYLRRGALVQGAAAGVGLRKPLSGDSGFFLSGKTIESNHIDFKLLWVVQRIAKSELP